MCYKFWLQNDLRIDSLQLYLDHDTTSNEPAQIEIPPLPSKVDLTQAYSDFLAYLYSTTKCFFENNTPNGARIGERLQHKTILVLCTPNDCDSTQQHFLRTAVVQAGIMKDKETRERLEFVTEAEASIYFMLAHTQFSSSLKKGVKLCIMNAGESTVDTNVYECEETNPKLVLKDVCGIECMQVCVILLQMCSSVSCIGRMEVQW